MTPSPDLHRSYSLPPLILGQFIIEMTLIAVIIVSFGGYLFNLDSGIQLGGVDYGLLTHKGGFAANLLRATGSVPLWDPFIGNGEPMLESLQSFVLNPLAITPFFIWGTPNGVKASVFFHMSIAGLGGWALGRVLGLRAIGRLLLALLLSSNGSFTGPFSRGVYELAISQAYIPWILAGVIGSIYLRSRVYIGLLAIATTLFVFCGTFWYVLPMVPICGLIVVPSLLYRDAGTRQLSVDMVRLRRLLIAGSLVVGLVMIRLLPLDRSLVYHPEEGEDRVSSFVDTAARYFTSTPYAVPFDYYWKEYHYIFSLPLLVVLLGLRLALWAHVPNRLPGKWVLPVVALVVIVGITAWAQGPTEPVKVIYNTLPFLKDWRNPARMAVVVTPWLAAIAAVCLDAVIRGLWAMQAKLSVTNVRRVAIFGAMAALIGWSALTATDVMRNWRRMVNFVPAATMGYAEPMGLRFLRDRYPHQFLNVINREWLVHYGFNHTMSRYAYGDAHVFAVGFPSTIGGYIKFLPEFAVSTIGFEAIARYHGYVPYPDAPAPTGIGPAAWYHPRTHPYAFWTREPDLHLPEEATAVSYWHQIDQIVVVAQKFGRNSLLVVQETAYPGWEVTINERPATLESVSGRLGVRVPDELVAASADAPVTVVFSYRPPKVYLGGMVTLLAALTTIIYLLRLDEAPRVREGLKAARQRLAPVWQALHSLYSKEI